MSSPLKDKITEDMKAAMRAKDSARLSAIRLLLAALKQREVDERIELSDADVLSAVEKMIKQRRESIAQFEKASRSDLADAEKFEVGVLSAYLPQQMGDAEVEKALAAAIAEAGATTMKDMGKVMALLKPRLAGKADMGKVSSLLKAKLSA
ncbi:MAG TPA: GatB/YqeY domain-containing protein [Burkholderiales bacterium]|nr:GatB/YqeY domain-containing protein [Burkholderiales bacterium]